MSGADRHTDSASWEEIRPHAWITTNRFFISADRRLIVKCHCPKKRHFRAHQYRLLRFTGYPIPFEFRSERARCTHERDIYAHWHAHGFNVPKLISSWATPLPAPADRCLVLEYIEGEILSKVLSNTEIAIQRKLALVSLLFRKCSERHALVFNARDRNLIKYDGNLRNIIVRNEELWDVDFECGRILEGLERGAAREISRYATEAIKLMGREFGDVIIELLRQEYCHTHVLDHLIKNSRKNSAQSDFSNSDLAKLLTAYKDRKIIVTRTNFKLMD